MLILASASPRRKEILSMLGYEFVVKVSDCDETVGDCTGAKAVALLSQRKAQAVSAQPEDTVIGCDTLVCLDNRRLGKPKNREDAKRMLRELSGKLHTVYTGVTIRRGEVCDTFVSHTDVLFYPLEEETIDAYVASGECDDKAGAYAVQGKGAMLIKKIDGDYFTVVGLPAGELYHRLKKIGIVPQK